MPTDNKEKNEWKSMMDPNALPTLPTDLPSSPFEGVDVNLDMGIPGKGELPKAAFPDVFGGERSVSQQSSIAKSTSGSSIATSPKQQQQQVDPFASVDSSKMSSTLASPKSTPAATATTTTTPSANNTMSTSSLRERVQPGVSQRTDFPLVRSKAALLVIDVQKWVTTPTSEKDAQSYLHQTAVPRMLHNIQALIKAFRSQRDHPQSQQQGCEVVFTYLQAATPDRRDISLDYKLSGSLLAHIPPPSATLPELFLETVMPDPHSGKGDILVPKTSCSVFASTNLDYVLRNLHTEQLVVCGQLTDQCVESAVRDAADLGYLVTVVPDACAAQSQESHAKGLHGMRGFCRQVETPQILVELQEQEQEVALMPPSTSAPSTSQTTATATRTPTPMVSTFTSTQERAYTTALLHSLECAGVQFLRYYTVDVCNTVRVKAVPLDQLSTTLNHKIALATVVVAGLPSFADLVTPGSGLDARTVMTLQPDLGTLRVLPYAPQSALVLGNLHDPAKGGALSELCTRGLLQKVCQRARERFQLEFCVGAEIEFCLHDAQTGKPVDNSIFCNSTTLNQQEAFLSDLYKQLKAQKIPIEGLHAESAPGQMEVILRYQSDAVRLVDFVVLTQETIRAVSRTHGLKALFLPKIHPMAAGNGLHLHLSFTDLTTGRNALAGLDSLSPRGQSFLEGILQHLPGLLGLTLPSVNSFRRVGPGCWTGSSLLWALEDKEAPLRVCASLYNHQEWQHVEYKLNDSTANLYLGLASLLTCGLDGMEKEIALRPQNQGGELPTSLEACLDCLEADELLVKFLGAKLSKAYLALRRAEAKHSSGMSLEEEVQHALDMA